MKRILILTIGMTLSLTAIHAQISPWEPVRGLNEPILAMGHSAGKLQAVTKSGRFTSTDNGVLWTLKERIALGPNNNYPIWMLDSVAVAILPKIVLNLNPELFYVLYRSVAGAPFVEGNWTFDPEGAWGASATIQHFYAADDSTLCIALRQIPTGGSSAIIRLYISNDAGLTWNNGLNLGSIEQKKCIANTGEGYWMRHLMAADSIFKYSNDGSTLLISAKVPSGGAQITGGFFLQDTLTLVTGSGQYYCTADNGNTWKNGLLPFDTVDNFWREKGLLYLQNSHGLYRSRHLWDSAWDTIYEKGISGDEGPNGVFRAGNSFFKQTNDYCPKTRRKLPTQTFEQWEPIQLLGLDQAAEPQQTILQNDSLFFRNNNCTLLEDCGGIFRPALAGPPQPKSTKHLNARFAVVPQNNAFAILRTFNDGILWDTVLSNIPSLGSFVSADARLFFYRPGKVIFSDNLGNHWDEVVWTADNLLAKGIDTLVRQTSPSQTFVSFDGGNNWAQINNMPDAGYLRLYQNKLALIVDKKVWVSTDWGASWPLTKEIFYPGSVFRTWSDKGVYIIDLHRASYPICENISVSSADGGIHWNPWPNNFRSNGNCSGALLPGTNAATNYLLHEDWLYAYTDLSGLWRARRSLLESNTPAWSRDTLCAGQTAEFFGDILTQSGFYEKIVSSSQGCDSIVFKSITFLPSDTLHHFDGICPGDSFLFGNQLLSQPGTYVSFDSSNCVISIEHLAQFDHATTVRDTTLTPGEVFLGQSPAQDTVLYQSLSTYQGCDSTIQWNVHILSVGVNDAQESIAWKIHPNPARDRVLVLVEPAPASARIRLLDVMGKVCREWDFLPGPEFTLDLPGIAPGCYWLEIYTLEGRSGKHLLMLN